MPLIWTMKDLGFLCWSTILLGLRKGWVNRKDVSDYAFDLLVDGNDDEEVAIIAGGESLRDDEIFDLISNQVRKAGNEDDLGKWRLAHILHIAESSDDDETKIGRLQEVYSNFDYPEDMASCSIYSQDEMDPLVAMLQVAEKLQSRFVH